MGSAQPGCLTHPRPVPGGQFLGSFSRARGEFSTSGLPCCCGSGPPSVLQILGDVQLSSGQPQLTDLPVGFCHQQGCGGVSAALVRSSEDLGGLVA